MKFSQTLYALSHVPVNFADRVRSLLSPATLARCFRFWPKPNNFRNYNVDKGLAPFNVFDLECYPSGDKLEHVPYAVGFTSSTRKTFSTHALKYGVSNGVEVRGGCFYKYAVKPLDMDALEWLGSVLKHCILLKKNRGIKWYAHNAGGYDNLIVLKALLKVGFERSRFEILNISDSLVKIRVYLSDPVENPSN